MDGRNGVFCVYEKYRGCFSSCMIYQFKVYVFLFITSLYDTGGCGDLARYAVQRHEIRHK